ncbi:MAG: hypothetical protein H6728_05470 [Myxococcales bacterium]|nr:hypothetical protein [Myxococcales bacterium]MCB9642505.1 hypothetical protein [Myxococcales bacterium]
MKKTWMFLCGLVLSVSLTGCTSFLVNSTKPVMATMIIKPAFSVFLQEEDLDLAKSAIGGQIKLAEIMRQNMQDDNDLNLLLCQGFASFGQMFEPERDMLKFKGDDASEKAAKTMTSRIRRYAIRGRAFCFEILEKRFKGFTEAALKGTADFNKLLSDAKAEDVPFLFWLGYAWGYAVINGLTEPELVAQIPQIKAIMERVVQLKEDYFYGAGHLFLGTLYAQSKMFGGDLKKSEMHFDKAEQFSQKKLLLLYYFKARFFAGQKNDTAGCRKLLKSVQDAPLSIAPKLKLVNQLAKKQAGVAQKHIDDFCP